MKINYHLPTMTMKKEEVKIKVFNLVIESYLNGIKGDTQDALTVQNEVQRLFDLYDSLKD